LYLSLQEVIVSLITRSHTLKLNMRSPRLELCCHSFAVRVLQPWNSLPEEVILSSSAKVFEANWIIYGKINQ